MPIHVLFRSLAEPHKVLCRSRYPIPERVLRRRTCRAFSSLFLPQKGNAARAWVCLSQNKSWKRIVAQLRSRPAPVERFSSSASLFRAVGAENQLLGRKPSAPYFLLPLLEIVG